MNSYPTTDEKFNESFHVWTDASRCRYRLNLFSHETIVDILTKVRRDELRHLARLLGVKQGRNRYQTAVNLADSFKSENRDRDPFSRGKVSISIIPVVVD